MRTLHLLAGLCIVAIPIAIVAQSPDENSRNSAAVAFLEAGKLFHIGFPSDRNSFVYSISELAESRSISADGTESSVTHVPITLEVKLDIFRVVKANSENWVLVEHPASPEEYSSWNSKHRAMILLQQPAKLSADRIRALKDSASRKIGLTQTWINIDHAITIKTVSKQSLGIAGQ